MRDAGLVMEEIDYAKVPLSVAAVAEIVAKAGSVAAVLNVQHATAKANNWKAVPPSAAVFAKAAAAEPNLLKRPIVIDGDRVIVGFNQTAYKTLTSTK